MTESTKATGMWFSSERQLARFHNREHYTLTTININEARDLPNGGHMSHRTKVDREAFWEKHHVGHMSQLTFTIPR